MYTAFHNIQCILSEIRRTRCTLPSFPLVPPSPSKLVFIRGKAITLIILPQLECGELG